MELLRTGKKDNSRRVFPGMGGARHNPVNIGVKREEAKARNEAWAKLSPQAQLESLDVRLGKGVGAVKQRAKIQSRIDRKKGNVPLAQR